MGQNTITFGVTKDHAIPIEPPLGGNALVQNLSGATLNTADDSQMSVDVSTITVGSSVTFTSPAFMKSQGSLSTVLVTYTTATGTGNGAQLTGNPADDTKSISAGTGIKLAAALLTGSSGDDTKAISAGTGIKLTTATLSGNTSDDVFALSAGTAQKLSISGASPAASVAAGNFRSVWTFGPGGANAPDGTYTLLSTATRTVGDGNGTQLSAVYSTLAAAQVVYPFATALTQSVDYCAVQLGINTIADQLHPPGGRLYIPHGLYKMRDGLVTLPGPPGDDHITIEGTNGTIHQPTLGSGSKFEWDNDVAGAPHFTFGIDATGCQNFALKNMSLQGPNVFPFSGGGHSNIPAVMGGVRVQGQSFIQNCSIEGFSTAIGYGGGTLGGFPVNHGFDHSHIDGLWINNCAFGIHLLPGSTAAGDQHWYRFNIDANCAGVAVAATASSGLTGSSVTGAGIYAPVGIYVYDDFPITGTHGASGVVGNQFNTVSFEQSYNGAVVCQQPLIGENGGPFSKNDITYMFQGPNVSLTGWGWNNAVVTSAPAGATGNQIQFTDGNGANWVTGMVVTDNTNPSRVPAGTTVTAIAGSWPYATPVMTLSNNLTADPTGDTLTIKMPKLGHVVAGTISNNIANTFAVSANFPVWWSPPAVAPTGQASCHDNVCWATTDPLSAAQSHPLTNGLSWNCFWGIPTGTFIGSGQMANGVGCTAGDLLMYDSTATKLVLCDGTRPPVGAAVLTTASTTPGTNVDFYINAINTSSIVVRNKTAGTIAANTVVKADTNAGGVTAAVGTGIEFIVGYTGSSSISAGASGSMAQLKC